MSKTRIISPFLQALSSAKLQFRYSRCQETGRSPVDCFQMPTAMKASSTFPNITSKTISGNIHRTGKSTSALQVGLSVSTIPWRALQPRRIRSYVSRYYPGRRATSQVPIPPFRANSPACGRSLRGAGRHSLPARSRMEIRAGSPWLLSDLPRIQDGRPSRGDASMYIHNPLGNCLEALGPCS